MPRKLPKTSPYILAGLIRTKQEAVVHPSSVARAAAQMAIPDLEEIWGSAQGLSSKAAMLLLAKYRGKSPETGKVVDQIRTAVLSVAAEPRPVTHTAAVELAKVVVDASSDADSKARAVWCAAAVDKLPSDQLVLWDHIWELSQTIPV